MDPEEQERNPKPPTDAADDSADDSADDALDDLQPREDDSVKGGKPDYMGRRPI